MPLMGKDLEIESYGWMEDVGLTSDQFAHVWTYGSGETAPREGEYRNLATGESLILREGEPFPAGRYASATDIPAPRYKQGTDSEEVTG